MSLKWPLNKGVSLLYFRRIQVVFSENTLCISREYKLYFPFRTCLYNLFSMSDRRAYSCKGRLV